MAVLISIVVPIYNADRYLEQCISSILSLSFSDYELILVNDGSEDNSQEICNKYALQDRRVRTINQENKGVAVARNNGMAAAVGEYIMFIDADDTINPETLDNVISGVLSINADLCFWGYRIFGHNIEKKVCIERFFGKKNSDLLYQLMTKNLFGIACNKAIRNSVIRQHKLEFPAGCKVFEDQQFMMRVWEKSNTVACLDEVPYNYIQHMESAYSMSSKQGLDEYIGLHDANIQCLTSFMNSNGIDEKKIDIYKYYYAKSEIGNILRNIWIQDFRRFIDAVHRIKESELILSFMHGYPEHHKGMKERLFYYSLKGNSILKLWILALFVRNK